MLVDYALYLQCYMGEPIPPEDFTRASAKAERVIKKITHGRDYNALPEWQQQAYKEAICTREQRSSEDSTHSLVRGAYHLVLSYCRVLFHP